MLFALDDDSGGSSDTLETKNDPRTKIEDSLGGEKVLATSSTSIRTQRDDSQKKTREFYGPNEHCYVMDAKSTGNIGRYLNVRMFLKVSLFFLLFTFFSFFSF